MLLLSSLHIHEQSQTDTDRCTECVEHHCGGHFTQLTVHQHDCVLCQFVSLPFLWAATVAVVFFAPKAVACREQGVWACPMVCVGNSASRAPPRSF